MQRIYRTWSTTHVGKCRIVSITAINSRMIGSYTTNNASVGDSSVNRRRELTHLYTKDQYLTLRNGAETGSNVHADLHPRECHSIKNAHSTWAFLIDWQCLVWI